FYNSVELRKLCCGVRKVEPLNRALKGLDAWMTGLRREQDVTRADVRRIELDEDHGNIIKINPLVDWSYGDVWDYIRRKSVPYNRLHKQGYPSIGCAPCTRAVKPGEDLRAGRWWWENPNASECGLHVNLQAKVWYVGYYPIVLEMKDRRCVVIGGGTVAERKVEGLLAAGANVTVISPAITDGLRGLLTQGAIRHVAREYRAGDR